MVVRRGLGSAAEMVLRKVDARAWVTSERRLEGGRGQVWGEREAWERRPRAAGPARLLRLKVRGPPPWLRRMPVEL